MTDICSICLDECNFKFCKYCSCVMHPKCIKEYINNMNGVHVIKIIKLHDTITEVNNIQCPNCKRNDTGKILTRSMKKYINSCETVKDYSDKITKLMRLFRTYESTKKKIIVFKIILDYIIQSDKLLFKTSSKFEVVVKDKLKEFYYKNNWYEAHKYYYTLFNTKLI